VTKRPLGEISQRQRDNAYIWFPTGSFGLGVVASFTFCKLHDQPADIPDRGPLWSESDGDSLVYTMFLEEHIQLNNTDPQTIPQARRFGTAVMRWHAALPFTVAERSRLLDLNRSIPGKSFQKLVPSIDALPETTVVSGGIQTVSDGRELNRRWLAWREQRDEFANQGSLIQARHALREIVELSNLPEDDRDLQTFRLHLDQPQWRTEPS
jgi:hypothetical protein